MDINELESYRLGDAIKFNDKLNPRLWSNEHLKPEVKQALLAIADDFREFLGIKDLDIQDITVSGSNAAYTYTPHSDIDLHLVVDLSKVCSNEVYRELFDAKKYQYNDEHNYRIGPYDVELYVQDSTQPHHSQGIYSLVNDDWVRVPVRRQPKIDDISVRSKYQDLGNRIEQALKSGNIETIKALWDKVKTMRRTGLAKTGEFGPENLTFKLLRRHGLLEKLKVAVNQARDQELSLQEQQPKKKKIYGYQNYWYPGYDYYAGLSQDVDPPSEVEESKAVKFDDKKIPLDKVVDKFVKFCAKHLHLDSLPKIVLRSDTKFGSQQQTMGHYVDDDHLIEVETHGRHVLDILRTLAHELVHYRQHRRGPVPDTAGDTGSPWEDEAHAVAGVLMRYFDRAHPEFFKTQMVDESTTDEDYDPNGPPPGPETKPTMPKGTIRVDVSDMYDWYKLGKNISNLKGADKSQFGKGPPSTIISFGDEDTEHKYIKDLENLGLSTTDIDPVDPNQPKGMPRQKTDPTYNVNEAFDKPYKLLRWEKGDYGDVDAIARLGDNTFLSIMFNKGFSQETKEEAWSVEFYRNNSQEVTGEGDAQRVFATVLSAIQTFIKKYKPNKVYFSASKEVEPGQNAQSRARLYDSLVQRYARAWGFTSSRSDTGSKVTYELSRIKPAVAESTGYIPVNDKEARDPRYSMAITQDIKPGEVQRQAAKMGFTTDAAGVPPLLMKLQNQLQEIKTGTSRWTYLK